MDDDDDDVFLQMLGLTLTQVCDDKEFVWGRERCHGRRGW